MLTTDVSVVSIFLILTESINFGADSISATSGFHSPTMHVFMSGRIRQLGLAPSLGLGTSQVFFILRCKWLSPAG